jgi:integrase
MNKKTLTLTLEQYDEIIETMKTGFSGCRPNKDMAMALVIEANMGLRISDILNLKLSDIVRDGDRYRLNIREQKTKKERFFTVLTEAYQHLKIYCLENNISADERIFTFTARGVQNKLKKVCDYLGYDGISTHSFRKFFATQIYIENDYNIALVQKLLQHSTVAVTQNYIGIQSQQIEDALKNHNYWRT